MSEVFVFIPARNEEVRIGKTINAVKEINNIKKIIVVDDGSEDKSSEIARKAGAEVLKLKGNFGKGLALKRAIFGEYIDVVRKNNIILLIDADLEDTASQAFKLIEALNNGKDISIAAFPKPNKKGGFGLVKKTARNFLKKKCGCEFINPLSGQRAIKAELLINLHKAFNYGFGLEVAMTLIACNKGAEIEEVMTNMRHRETGRSVSDFYHRGKQMLSLLRVMVDYKLGKLN